MAGPKLKLTRKNFWFQRRNVNGEPFGEYMGVDERTAWNYIRATRSFVYYGYSDGRHIVDSYRKINEGGAKKQLSGEDKKLINDAVEMELEEAKKNVAIRPKDFTKQNLGGGPMDPRIRI